MIFFLLLVPSYQLYCLNDVSVYASTYERKQWDLGKYILGNNVIFSINGDSDIFEVKQVFEPFDYDVNSYNFSDVELIDLHISKNGIYETQIKAVLILNNTKYQIKYPQFDNLYFETQINCSFVRIIDNDCILLANSNKMWIAKTNHELNFSSSLQQIKVYDNLIITLTSDNIKFYYYENDFLELNITINTTVIRAILQDQSYVYNLLDVYFSNNNIILLDELIGIIVLEIKNQIILKLKYYYHFYIQKYYSMDILETDSSYLIAISTIDNSILILDENQIINYLYIDNQNLSTTHVNLIGIKEKYVVLTNSTFISVYSTSYQYQKYSQLTENQRLYGFNHNLGLVYILDLEIQQWFIITNGLLIMNPFNEAQEEIKNLQVIATEYSQCSVTFQYVVFDYLDNNLYVKKNVLQQVKQFVNYPTYPQSSIFKEIGVSGQNIVASMKLNDDSIQLKLSYYEKLIINGINYEQNQLLYVNIYYYSPYTYYIIQDVNLEVQLYQCITDINNYELSCEILYTFNPETQFNNYSFQWIFDDNLKFGYISNTQNFIQFYELIKNNVSQLFILTLNDFDQNTQITSFTLTDELVYVVIQQKSQIVVFNFQSQQQVYTITKFDVFSQEFLPKNVKILKNSNILIIENLYTLIIGYYFNSFFLIECLQFQKYKDLQISTTDYQFFVAIIYGNVQELREYSFRMNKLVHLKTIPLFHYMLQEPLQMISAIDLLIIRGYTPVLQQTVLLVFQFDTMLRESLLTYVPLGQYYKGILNLGISSYQSYGLFLHVSSSDQSIKTQNIFLYRELQALITAQYSSQYLHQKTIIINYSSVDSPEKIQFNQEVTFLNLMTNIEAKVEETIIYVDSYIIPISNDLFQGQIISFDIECPQCNERILLTQKISEISSINHYNQLLGQCQLQEDFYVVLTYKFLIFLNSQHYVKHQPFYFILDDSLSVNQIWCKNEIIMLTGLSSTSKTFIQLILYEDDEFRQIGDPYYLTIKSRLQQLEILENGNFLILDGYQNTMWPSRLCPYHYQYRAPKYVTFLYTGCVDSRKHPEFYIQNFIVYKIKDSYRVILSELNDGLFIQDFYSSSDTFKLIYAAEQLQRVSVKSALRKEFDIKIGDGLSFIQIVKNGEPMYNYQNYKIILLTNYYAHLSLILKFEEDVVQEIHIVELLQRYSEFQISILTSLLDNYLALMYIHSGNLMSICIYKLQNQTQNLEIPNIILGGIEMTQSFYQFFSLLKDENGQLLLQASFKNYYLNLYIIEDNATLTFLDDAKDQDILLIAKNTLCSSKTTLKSVINNKKTTSLYWILLSILFFFIFILIILSIVLYFHTRKAQKQKKQAHSKNLLK